MNQAASTDDRAGIPSSPDARLSGSPPRRRPTVAQLRTRAIHLAVDTRNRCRRWAWDALGQSDVERRVRSMCVEWQDAELAPSLPGPEGRVEESALDRATRRGQPSYVCRYVGDCLLEPRYGYVIDRPFQLVDRSMPFTEWSRDPDVRDLIGFPSVSRVGVAQLGRADTVREDRVLSLRFHWETNYFHFLNDILPRLRLADAHGVERDVPVVVAERLARQPFFQSAFPDGHVAGRRVIVQRPGTFIACREVILVNPGRTSAENAEFVADLLGAPRVPTGDRRLFLDRAASRGRSITNKHELAPLLDRHQLEVVDAAALTVPEQVSLFSSAALIVAIHGAGLANMIFRRHAHCSIVEILPPTESPPWFFHLADALGFDYVAVRGRSLTHAYDRRLPFAVDPVELEQHLLEIDDGRPSSGPTALPTSRGV